MKWITLPLLGTLVLAACAGKPSAAAVVSTAVLPMDRKTPPYQILDYQGKNLGEDVPEWVSLYIDAGSAGVESLPQYQQSYVFIAENSGKNINALKQWALGFVVDQDFPQMVSSRVQARLINTRVSNLDQVYGRYFENLVKNSFDASYSGVQKETDFWILKQNVQDDETSEEPAIYYIFVLVKIDKQVFRHQLTNILNRTTGGDAQLTREQAAAVDRLKANFYEGF